jgi:hypothetical protein
MNANATGPGSWAIAADVALVLTPSPATIKATRGAPGLPANAFTGRAKTSAGRVPSAAIFGTGPCEVISANFCSGGAAAVGAAAPAGSGITTSCRAPVLPSMMVMVLVFAGGFAGVFFSGGAEAGAGPS